MTLNAGSRETQAKNVLEQALDRGVQAARSGNKELARRLLRRVTELDPTRETAWLWLASVAATPDEANAIFQTVLAINPASQGAREGLRWLQSRSPAATAPGPTPPPSDAPAVEGLPSLVLSVEQAEAIDACLAGMAADSDARCIVLADVTGQLIAERGHVERINTQVLSALAAGELAATHEMARLVGEQARFKLLLHEGETQSVYLSDVGERLILVIVFDNDTPIGLVRLVLKRAVQTLAPILLAPAPAGTSPTVNDALAGDFARLLGDELDTALEL